MFRDRLVLYQELEEARGSRVLVYITGDRQGMETQIHSEIVNFIVDHLDSFSIPGKIEKISLFLYSRGGETLAGWTIVNLIRQFCRNFEVIVPSKAHSSATLICLGADQIIMTKQATLGPIDPSINTPLNPQMPGAPGNIRIPISVEAVASYFELAKKELALTGQNELASIFLKLADHVHPVALGGVYRSRAQIQMLAEKLLRVHMNDEERVKKIISVLCSESGSHDYTIARKEARDELALPIEKPDDHLYSIINRLFFDIRAELELDSRFNPHQVLGASQVAPYSATRGMIESISGGSHKYLSEGTLTKIQIQTQMGPQEGINDLRTFEGWRHEGL